MAFITSILATAFALILAATPSSSCTVYGSYGKVIISMAGRGHGNWAGLNDGSVMYKSWNNDAHAIDQPGGDGSSRVFVNFQVPTTSEYVITGESVARHQTEYNDAWLRVWNGKDSPHGLFMRCMCNPGHQQSAGSNYLKAYQNSGGWSRELYTVDHQPHAITGYFEAGKTYTLELSGRSMSFGIKTMMIVSCSGSECTPTSGTVSGNLDSGMGGMSCV